MTQQDYIDAITAKLVDADIEVLRLIWIVAHNLTRK